jgi:hypothetical protein
MTMEINSVLSKRSSKPPCPGNQDPALTSNCRLAQDPSKSPVCAIRPRKLRGIRIAALDPCREGGRYRNTRKGKPMTADKNPAQFLDELMAGHDFSPPLGDPQNTQPYP